MTSDYETKYLQKKLTRKEMDIENLRAKLDMTLDELDKESVRYETLRNYIMEKEGLHAFREKFMYVPAINQEKIKLKIHRYGLKK